MVRRRSGCVLAACTLALAVALGVAPADAASSEGLSAQFHAEFNAERAARGLAPLAHDGQIAAAAQSWAHHLEGAGSLSHSASGRAEVVGTGSRTGQVTEAWMRSAGHRRLIADANMVAVGIGVTCDDAGRMWVVAQFRQAVPGRSVPSAPSSPRATSSTTGATCADGGAESTVRRLYAAFLNRPVDAEGLQTWTARAAAGESSTAIGRMLASSPEFAARHRGLGDREFVAAAYRNVLGREPDHHGLEHWLKVLRSTGRVAVLQGFADSTELRQLTGWS